jgi:exosortase/archaeosortase family protein
MKKSDRRFLFLFLRYIILVLVAIPGMDLFYYVFLPLTKYPVFWVLEIFYDPVMLTNTIFVGNKMIEIVGACVAGAAYYFLLILALSTLGINWTKRLKIIGLSFGIFLFINVIRIIILSFMFIGGSVFFDVTHKLFWYVGSTLFVIIIWFLCVKIFNIEKIPIYSDLKFIYNVSSLKKNN